MAVIDEVRRVLPQGCTVVAGLSGGADSVCLLHALVSLGVPVTAVHVHHGIRGDEADRDAAFARDFCASLGVPFQLVRVDVPAYAARNGMTTEQAARSVRYRELFRIRCATGADYVCVAHNRNDQAETVLLRLVRGTGLKGLCAMEERRADGLLRPLLNVTRAEIEEYCTENNLKYVFDSTNADTDYSRNAVRSVMPVLTGINPSAASNIARSAALLRRDEDCLNSCAASCGALLPDGSLLISALTAAHPAIAARALRAAAQSFDSLTDIEETHIDALLNLCEKQSGREITLPRGVTVRRAGDRLVFLRKSVVDGGSVPLAPGQTVFDGMLITVENAALGARQPGCEYLSPNSVREAVIRHRRTGDRLHPLGAPGSKSLARWLVDKKIPVNERDSLLLVCRGSEVLAVIGYTVAESARASGMSVKITVRRTEAF